MVHINGRPVRPHKQVLAIQWNADGTATAEATFTSRRYAPEGALVGDHTSSASADALTAEEQAQLYALTVKLFESRRSQEMLRTDEYLATLPPVEVPEE